jgi:uncharacterized FAD-dependent dehydrogenase
MNQLVDIRLLPEEAFNEEIIASITAQTVGIFAYKHLQFKVVKRSIDARKRQVYYNLRVSISEHAETTLKNSFPSYKNVEKQPAVTIIGSGPAGLFAALKLIELGIKPVLFERGKDVRERRRDLAAINKQHLVNPESNYCFGEGGAGTYSDGKLYTRSTKRGDVDAILNTFIKFGANPDIAVDAHPHIGTNKLPEIIVAMRQKIIDCGGEVHFNSKLTNLFIENGAISGIEINNSETHSVRQLILATGHSARDIFELLAKNEIQISAKEFALGVRIEHPQVLIDQIQYHCDTRSEYLPPAAYKWVEQVDKRGVYSFCMCPGGIIAPCATSPQEVVTNGWSPSKRNNPFANSGVVVNIQASDWEDNKDFGPLAAMEFQRATEKAAWEAGGRTQSAPAQRLVDFLKGELSSELPKCSYQPGIVSADLRKVLPDVVWRSLSIGLKSFVKKMPRYLSEEAVMVGVESRTSSPVRIPRKPDTLEHIEVKGLYPCGEGAGYAGGIVSAAIDGEKCAIKCAEVILLATENK